jgi:hypothetical protein
MKIKKSIASFLGGGALLAIAYTIVHAACLTCPPPGSLMVCGNTTFQCDASLTTTTGPATFTTFAAGANLPTFTVISTSTSPSSISLQPVSWSGSGSSPTLGTVNWAFDVSRAVPNTTITANQIGPDFPATAHIRTHIIGTIAAYPGVMFISKTPLDFTSTSVTSFNPFISQIFTLATPVVFVDQANPTSGPSFTLNSLNLTLNG